MATLLTPANGPSKKDEYTLYHSFYSVCSIMMRLMMAVRGEQADPSVIITVAEKQIDIFNEEQLSEWYLSEVNPKGQVRDPKSYPSSVP
jgi:hypothetical protein